MSRPDQFDQCTRFTPRPGKVGAARLHPDDLAQIIERTARRVVELQREAPESSADARLLSPAEVAIRTGRSVDWVREHADDLGVLRVGDGPKPRLYFRAAAVDAHLSRLGECGRVTGPAQPASLASPRRKPSRQANPTDDLLPIRGHAA